jgi:L-iditol 2-dehydrogenase
MTPGHEVSGEVCGGTGEPYELPDGTLVAVDPAQPCGGCEQCHAGYPNLCPHVRFLGSPGVDGGMCELLSVPARNVHRVPDCFDPTLAALLEPLGVAVHALDITKLRPDSSVAVLGGGPIGLMLTQVAKVWGAAHVRLVEPNANHTEALEATSGRGEDYVIEATDSSDGPDQAAHLARIGGKVTLVGIPEGDRFHMTAANARRKGLTLRFSRRIGQVYPRAIALVAEGKVTRKGE